MAQILPVAQKRLVRGLELLLEEVVPLDGFEKGVVLDLLGVLC